MLTRAADAYHVCQVLQLVAPVQIRPQRGGAAVRQAEGLGDEHVPDGVGHEVGGAAGGRHLPRPCAWREVGVPPLRRATVAGYLRCRWRGQGPGAFWRRYCNLRGRGRQRAALSTEGQTRRLSLRENVDHTGCCSVKQHGVSGRAGGVTDVNRIGTSHKCRWPVSV